MTEPTFSHSASRGIMVAMIVTPVRWVPLKTLNGSDSPVTLWRNAKFVDIYSIPVWRWRSSRSRSSSAFTRPHFSSTLERQI